MKLFELAREINLPSKELITLMRQWGMEVSGAFQVLDNKAIKTIKEHLKKSPKPAAAAQAPPIAIEEDTDDSQAQLKSRRRLVSVRSSGEVRRLEEEKAKPKKASIPQQTLDSQATEPAEAEASMQEKTEPDTSATLPQAANIPSEELTKKTSAAVASPHSRKRVEEFTADEEETPSRRRERRGERKRDSRTEWRDLRGNARDLEPLQHEGWVRPRHSKRTNKRKGLAASEEKHTFNPRQKAIKLGPTITVAELASLIGVKGANIIKKLMELEITATMNDVIDGSTAELVALEYNVQVEVDASSLEDILKTEDIPAKQLEPRPPIITIMGHVDHGKTTLLDKIRASQVASGEAGGITQHIGAYRVDSEFGTMVFLDTPGHEAFTALRQRGANVTDIVVLLVAADDGVMPQTIEAIQHAQAAKAPIVVAANKVDRPNSDLNKVKQQLLQHNLVIEELGGETMLVPISAKTGKGIKELLEHIHLQAELLNLKSTAQGKCSGVVIESHMDRAKGVVGSVLVQRGKLEVGNYFVAGACSGRVRAMYNDKHKRIKQAFPSTPVELTGYDHMPEAGDPFNALDSEREVRQLAELRALRKRAAALLPRNRVSLENFMENPVAADEYRTLNLVLKADTQGSLEAILGALAKEGNNQLSVQVVRSGVGGITQTDISLASVSNAVVIGFHVRADNRAAQTARAEGVDVKFYNVIYELVDNIHLALEGMLQPVVREQIVGRCEVRQVFAKSKEGVIAGGQVEEGKLERNAQVRLYRDDVLQGEGSMASLRRYKEDVQSVQQGSECGFRISGYNDLKAGDVIEAFLQIEEKATLQRGGREAARKELLAKTSVETTAEVPTETLIKEEEARA